MSESTGTRTQQGQEGQAAPLQTPTSPPDWVKNPARAYAEIQAVREEARGYREQSERQALQLIQLAVAAEAAKRGFIDPQDAVSAIDPNQFMQDEQGQMVGIPEALEALAKAKPHWIKTNRPFLSPSSAASRFSATNPAGTGPTLTREALKKMSPQEIQALDWELVKAVLKDS
jgi:hypothetical protein